MALRTGHITSQESRHQVGHAIQGHLRIIQQETRRTVIAQPTIGGEHLAHHTIPRGISSDASLEPILEAERGDSLVESVFHAQEVSHPVKHLQRVA